MLTVQLAAGESLPAGDRALLADLSSHAGLLVHNAVLAEQLSQHVQGLTERAVELAVVPASAGRRAGSGTSPGRARSARRCAADAGRGDARHADACGRRHAAGDRTSIARGSCAASCETKVELAGIAGGQLPVALRDGGLARRARARGGHRPTDRAARSTCCSTCRWSGADRRRRRGGASTSAARRRCRTSSSTPTPRGSASRCTVRRRRAGVRGHRRRRRHRPGAAG